ncbi:interleukin-11 [Lepisosteus oculatus]|uniref:interleukin-11 n=1 Tax=Lepisosteus oculatus TaxID=7918 RepID=UPI003722999A
MRLLGDSSPPLLLSLLLAQLSAFASGSPASRRPHGDFDKLANQTLHLLKLTKALLKDHVVEGEIEHRFHSLPVLNSSANDLQALQVKVTLPQMLSDFYSYELHFEWLKRASRPHGHSHLPRVTEVLTVLKSVNSTLQRQLVKMGLSRLPPPSPSLPAHTLPLWEVAHASRELLQQLRLFSDWASRALIALKSKA